MPKEINLTINTQEGVNQFTTKRMDGILRAIIIENAGKTEINIRSEKGYSIYFERDHDGVFYISPKIRARDPNAIQLDSAPDNVNLNERLIITVSGTKNSDVKFTLRFI